MRTMRKQEGPEGMKALWRRRPEILLCPNIPQPLHGIAPRVILGSKWWDATRKAAYRSTRYHCIACGVHKYRAKYHQWLEGHELYLTDYRKGRLTYLETVPLCHFCHNFIHDGRLMMLLRNGEIHHAKYAAILQHGRKVLDEAGLRKESRKQREEAIMEMIQNGEMAPWEEWRLVLFGKEYLPRRKSDEDRDRYRDDGAGPVPWS